MANNDVPQEYYGWWRIIDKSQWTKKYIDTLGTALISLTGYDDRLRMFALLAYVNCILFYTALSGQISIDLLLMENPGNVKGFLSFP